MGDAMGTVRVRVEIENPARPGERRMLDAVLVVRRVKVWRFRQADGTILERWTGEVRIRVASIETPDEVVFGEPGDLVLPGARSLEGLNLRVDPVSKQLVDAGPAPAAAVGALTAALSPHQLLRSN